MKVPAEHLLKLGWRRDKDYSLCFKPPEGIGSIGPGGFKYLDDIELTSLPLVIAAGNWYRPSRYYSTESVRLERETIDLPYLKARLELGI